MAEEEKKETSEVVKAEAKVGENRHVNSEQGAHIALVIILIVIALGGLAAFGAMTFAHHEAKLSKNIEFAGRPMMVERGERGFDGDRMMGRAHARAGVTGVVTAINGNNLTVKDSSAKEWTVVVSDSTPFVKAGEIAKQSDLATNNVITARGPSNSQGQIAATVIQIW